MVIQFDHVHLINDSYCLLLSIMNPFYSLSMLANVYHVWIVETNQYLIQVGKEGCVGERKRGERGKEGCDRQSLSICFKYSYL